MSSSAPSTAVSSSSSSSSPSSVAVSSKIPAWKHFVAGNLGGIFGLSLCYPLDTVKVRIQTRSKGSYAGVADCMKTMVREEGIVSLYRGILSPVVGYGFIKSAAFGSYNQMKDLVSSSKPASQQKDSLSIVELVLCGAYAGVIQTFVRAPVEQIKVVMQARNKASASTQSHAPSYTSTLACISDVYRTEGILKGFYRSFWPTLWREIPQYGIYYAAYEVSKEFCQKLEGKQDLSAPYYMLSGGIAGVAIWLPTYPLDVIKSKISAAPPGTYRGFGDCAAQAIRQEGVGVFFRGISAALLRAFPLHGAVFMGYELTMKLLLQ